MNRKTLLILFGILIALGVAASFPLWRDAVGFMRSDQSEAELDFSELTKDDTGKVVIVKKGEEKKILERKDGVWMIDVFEAAPKTMDVFFDSVKSLKVGALVSKNKNNFSGFGVGEEGYEVTFSASGKEDSFVIGSSGSSFGSFYARKKDGANVYRVEGKLPDTLSQPVSFWRDKALLSISKDEIGKIEILSKIAPLSMIRTQDGKWQAESGSKKAVLEETLAKRLIEALDTLEGSDFLTKEQEAEFRKTGEKTVLRLSDSSGKKLAEVQLLKRENDWWAIAEGRPFAYKVPAYRLSDILLTPEQAFGSGKK